MIGYLVRRLALGVSVLFAVFTATFTLFYFGPADPADAMCGEVNCTPQRYNAIRAALGMDRPKLEQYWEFLSGIFVGRQLGSGTARIDCDAPCLGYSFKQGRPVTEMLTEYLPPTLSIAVGGAIVFVTVGVLMGALAATKRGTLTDKGLMAGAALVSSFPYYLLAVLASLYLTIQTGFFPRPGYVPLTGEDGSVLEWFKGLLLAWLVLGIVSSTVYARYTRASMTEILGEDYIRSAHAKGLPSRTVNFRHGLRAALAPIATVLGLDIATLLGGTLITEQVFEIEGIGYLGLEAVKGDDFPVIMGTVLFSAVMVIVMNIVIDVAYGFLDPRVRVR